MIKADRGDAANYYSIERATSGLNLTDKYGDFLAEMSQGVAHLDHVVVPTPLDASQVVNFGLRGNAVHLHLILRLGRKIC